MFGYGLLGAGWLILKTEGELQAARAAGTARSASSACVIAVLHRQRVDAAACMPEIAERWFSWPNIALLAPVPIATALAAFWDLARARAARSEAGTVHRRGVPVRALLHRHRDQPVADDRALSLSPCGRPPPRRSTQAFLLVGTLFLLPMILIYTGWSYWVFRGKVRGDIGYHH